VLPHDMLRGVFHWRATLAQLVERLIRNQQVASSILAGGSKTPIKLGVFGSGPLRAFGVYVLV
jgi:hypothetical protein